MLIDDLQTMLDTFKFVDDVTLCEVVADPSISQMQVAARQMVEWSRKNLMNINIKKTKEMLLGPILLNPPPLILVNDGTVERVTSFKLLGLTIANNLSWEEHITTICSKANKRLHYLKLLKRCSVSVDDLLHYYKSIIRPTIEYACPVWQSGLTTADCYGIGQHPSLVSTNWSTVLCRSHLQHDESVTVIIHSA
jgi:hypothetical protein